jgi:hypothetical protein
MTYNSLSEILLCYKKISKLSLYPKLTFQKLPETQMYPQNLEIQEKKKQALTKQSSSMVLRSDKEIGHTQSWSCYLISCRIWRL